MKRIIGLFALASVLLVSSAALADGVATDKYYAHHETKTNDVVIGPDYSAFQTILITKDGNGSISADDIVYIDQAESSFAGVNNFLIKANPLPGEYTVRFGSGSGNGETYKMVIGAKGEASYEDIIMRKIGDDINDENVEKHRAGYVVENLPVSKFNAMNSVKVLFTNGGTTAKKGLSMNKAFPNKSSIKGIEGNGTVSVGFQLKNLTAAQVADIEVYLSEQETNGHQASTN